MRNAKQVESYAVGILTAAIPFPADRIRCQSCRFCRSEPDLKRFWCRVNGELVVNPYADGLPDHCPIKFEEEENENI